MRGLIVLLLSACAAPDSTEHREPITNGAADNGDPAVVLIVSADGTTPHCTGTLIGTHTVLTAAHCEIDASTASAYRVFFGAGLGSPGVMVEIADARSDPAYDSSTHARDLALLTLREQGPALPLLLDRRTPDASWLGQTFTVVGFGVTSAGSADAGQKRAGTSRWSAVDSVTLTALPAPSQPCAIDSGGPALFDDGGMHVVSGVVSAGDTECADHTVFARVDVALQDFVDPYLAATAPGTAAPGERCLYSEQCTAGACLQAADEPLLWFCSPPCSATTDCPAQMICTAGACRYPLPSPGATGWACAAASDCVSGTCMGGSCTRRCVPVGTDCPSGFQCERAGGTDFYCRPAPMPASGCAAAPGAPGMPAALLLLISWRRRGRSGSSRSGRSDHTPRGWPG